MPIWIILSKWSKHFVCADFLQICISNEKHCHRWLSVSVSSCISLKRAGSQICTFNFTHLSAAGSSLESESKTCHQWPNLGLFNSFQWDRPYFYATSLNVPLQKGHSNDTCLFHLKGSHTLDGRRTAAWNLIKMKGHILWWFWSALSLALSFMRSCVIQNIFKLWTAGLMSWSCV